MRHIIRKNQFLLYRIVFAVAFLLLILFTGISYNQIKSLENSTGLVIHTHKINTELEKIFSHIKDAETGQRGYLLTYDTLYLKPYNNSYILITQSFSQLKYLLQDNPEQCQNLQILFLLTTSRLNLMAEILEQSKNQPVSTEMKIELKRGKILMDRIRLIVNKMQRAERILLRERMVKMDRNLWFAPTASLLLLIFSIAVAALSYYKVNADYENQKVLVNQLNLQNATFKHAELASNQGTYSWNLKTGKVNFSDHLFRILGYSPNEFEPCFEDFYKYVHPDDAGLAVDFFNHDGIETKTRTVEYRIKTKDGLIKQLKGISLLFETNGGATVIGTLQDITVQKEAETNLIRTNERLSNTDTFLNTLINTSPNGIWVYEAIRDGNRKIVDFKITFANEASAIHNSINTPSELIGKKLLGLNPGVIESGYFDRLVTIVNTGEKMEFELYYDFPNLPRTWFNNYMEKMGDGVTVTFSNITQLKDDALNIERINKELEAKNKELEKSNAELISFNHIASHDLQEPLRKIQAFITRIKSSDEQKLSEQGKQYFERILNAAQRMQKLITDLLVFSNTSNFNKPLGIVNLNAVMLFVKDELQEIIKEKEATITYDDLPNIKGIEFQLQQLFNNLIANAIKYSKTSVNPIIEIRYAKVDRSDNTVLEYNTAKEFHRISVSDNGIGFNQLYADRIFKLFQRLHDKTQYVGTGIGLAICKKIVENHNGIITVTSTEGIGSNFYIYLPV